MEVLSDIRKEFTVFSGLSHPGVTGVHSTDNCFLSNPGAFQAILETPSRWISLLRKVPLLNTFPYAEPMLRGPTRRPSVAFPLRVMECCATPDQSGSSVSRDVYAG